MPPLRRRCAASSLRHVGKRISLGAIEDRSGGRDHTLRLGFAVEPLLTNYEPVWPFHFKRVSRDVKEALGTSVVAVHHIGSTALPVVEWVKPVVDVLAEVERLGDADAKCDRLLAGGFAPRGEYGLPGRRYFVRPADSAMPRVHLHIYEAGEGQVDRHLAFRDYLQAHPDEAKAYGELKRRLADVHRSDKGKYQQGKAEFIARIEEMAARWKRANVVAEP